MLTQTNGSSLNKHLEGKYSATFSSEKGLSLKRFGPGFGKADDSRRKQTIVFFLFLVVSCVFLQML